MPALSGNSLGEEALSRSKVLVAMSLAHPKPQLALIRRLGGQWAKGKSIIENV